MVSGKRLDIIEKALKSMSIILHVTKRGHKCHNPLSTPPASYIKAGEVVQLGKWQLYYRRSARAYRVLASEADPVFEFTSFNCAAAKLAELGQ